MLSPDQLALRRTGIGSSDIAAIADLDPHRAAIDVWLDKLGRAEQSTTTATWIGDRLEQAVADLYAERLGIDPANMRKLPLEIATCRHAEHPWALATPDRVVLDPATGALMILEIKNVGGFMAHLWGDPHDGAPLDKILQVQWQLEVCDLERAHIAALIGGTDFRIYDVPRDREMGAELIELGRLFWETFVIPRVPPEHDGAAARKLAAMRWPSNSGAMVPATSEAEALRDRLLRVKRLAKRAADLQAHLEARAMELIGASDGVEGCFTWKRPKGGEPTWQGAARAAWMASAEASWESIAKLVGADERRWEGAARAAGATEPRAERSVTRRFLVKEPKQEKGGRR